MSGEMPEEKAVPMGELARRDRASGSVAREPASTAIATPMQAASKALQRLFAKNEFSEEGDSEVAFMNPRRIMRKGQAVVIVFVLGFLGWASFAELESAILAPGVLVVESRRKAVQHLEGGIVREIAVTDGETVKAGQVLLQLEQTQAQSSLSVLEDQADSLSAQEARLVAERDNRAKVTFPADLLARRANPKVAQAIAGEENNFTVRRNTIFKQVDILNQRNGENGRQIAGLKSQQEAVEKQSQLIAQEEASVSELYKQGLSTLPRVLALQRQAADLSGQRGQLVEKIAQIQLSSEENDLQIANLRNQRLSDIASDLRDAQTKKADVLERINAAKDVYTRLALLAPVDGKVVNLAVHTKGAVIHPGDTVLEIVPMEDALEVEAHVRPDDADSIQKGMLAHVSFSAYKQRRLPQLTGTVNVVSADRLTDPRSGQPYFNVTVTVDRKALDDSPFVRLIPGLPVDVAIATGTRTPLEYFTAPIRDILQKGMRER